MANLIDPQTVNIKDEDVLDLARKLHEEEGILEIDNLAEVCHSMDNGAYVQAWVWVPFADTHLDKEKDKT